MLKTYGERLTPDEITQDLAKPSASSHLAQRGQAVFLPKGDDSAYVLVAEKKELFGKIAHLVGGDTSDEKYALVYEFNQRALLMDARLIKENNNFDGRRLSQNEIAKLQNLIDNHKITIYNKHELEAESVQGVFTQPTGGKIIALRKSGTLYFYKDGIATKMDAHYALQGGNTRIYQNPDGSRFELNFSRSDQNASKNPADYGISTPQQKKYKSPFTKA